ncbi:MAG TPA: 30S ribosomal protein S17 [Candidatus Thermoplasmatota archaeon]|nr:30S ribosomal protein S17 [Candidatus Thermoplasmatota archaeon]
MAKDIGIDVQAPKQTCTDPHCPFHGSFPVRGQVLVGRVVSTGMQKSVVVEREYFRYMQKYERYEKRTRRYSAHAPPCMPMKVGDEATIMECRPISKTKSFVVVESKAGQARIMGDDYTTSGKESAPAKESGQ